jgi:hypothetical protein
MSPYMEEGVFTPEDYDAVAATVEAGMLAREPPKEAAGTGAPAPPRGVPAVPLCLPWHDTPAGAYSRPLLSST